MRRGDIAAAIRFEVREHMAMCTAAPASSATRWVVAAEKFNMAFEVSLDGTVLTGSSYRRLLYRATEIVNAQWLIEADSSGQPLLLLVPQDSPVCGMRGHGHLGTFALCGVRASHVFARPVFVALPSW